MESALDPRQALARRLRALREGHWPDIKITQPQLAQALGGRRPLSVPLISSWESLSNPRIPPIRRLQAYAAFFATPRSLHGETPRLLDSAEMTDDERRARDELVRELMQLRNDALRATAGEPAVTGVAGADEPGLWSFDDGMAITIVCAQLPEAMRERIPYTDPASPDYVALYTFADLDALFEVHGHLRAMNPNSQVNFRAADQLVSDDYTTHLISLGGVDWNLATRSTLGRLDLPVQQVAEWGTTGDAYFEVTEGERRRFYPQLDDRQLLREDVAMFARAENPYNRRRTVTICNGMYGAGTLGAVRALTDARFRDRNNDYLQRRFGDSTSFCVLTRVVVENGAPLTPDWDIDGTRLFEWAT